MADKHGILRFARADIKQPKIVNPVKIQDLTFRDGHPSVAHRVLRRLGGAASTELPMFVGVLKRRLLAFLAQPDPESFRQLAP